MLLALQAQLFLVGDVLVLAAATASEVAAPWFYAERRRRDDPHQLGPAEMLLGFGDFHLHLLADQHERNEEDILLDPRDAVATKGDVGDLDDVPLTGERWRKFAGFTLHRVGSWQIPRPAARKDAFHADSPSINPADATKRIARSCLSRSASRRSASSPIAGLSPHRPALPGGRARRDDREPVRRLSRSTHATMATPAPRRPAPVSARWGRPGRSTKRCWAGCSR